MAYIHESLYQNKNFSNVNFSDYLIMLVKNLYHSYNVEQGRIKLHFDVIPLQLNLDTSIPCGLILNELVSNSFKYAFPNNKEGFIFVSLQIVSDKIVLTIADNGVGLPDSIDYKNTDSLGLQLVVTLVEQIDAKLELDKSKGTKFIITFNNSQNV
jgi:two-component sensor histidine kinase